MKKLMKTVPMILLITAIFSISAFATDGYFSHGYGTKNKSMGGIGVAMPLGPMAPAANPASLFFLDNSYEISIALFSPFRDYTITGNPSGYPNTFPLTPGKIESDSKFFIIPSFSANWRIDEKSTFGLALFGNGGMNTDYDTKTFNHPMLTVTQPTGVNLSQMFAALTYAREFVEDHSFGVTGIVAYQWFKATGMQAFGGYSSDAMNLTDNDNSKSFGFGARFGYMGRLSSKFSVGASYQTKMFMSEFEEYAGLFAEQGDFDIPSNWTVGFAVHPNEKFSFAFDLQQIKYSEVNSVGNLMNPQQMAQGVALGSDNGAGFGWQDMTVFKLGSQYVLDDEWSFRAGYSFGEQPVPDTEVMFNILAPGIIEQHLTFGLSKMFGDREFNIAVMRAFSKSVTGANPMEAPGQQDIKLRMDQWEFEISLGF
ncbi:OmpP1/FadL family transporter [candidate division KSB1 bacterium]